MSLKLFAKSRVITAILILGAFIITAGLLISRIEGIEIWAYDWRSVDWRALVSNKESINGFFIKYASVLSILAVPAIYSLFILLLLGRKQKNLELTSQTGVSSFSNSESSSVDVGGADADAVKVTEEITEEPASPSSQVAHQNSGSKDALVERLRKDLVKTEQQLNSAQAVKSQFLANMSHELRTPMNGILGMTELLMGSSLDQRQSRFADSVRRSAEALLAIINDLLDYSKMEAGDLFLENSVFNLREVVEDVCDLQADLAQRKGVELICHIDRSINESVVGDSNRVRQMLTNLVGNAIKFTREGEVVVRLKQNEVVQEESTYQIDIVDTGIGITPEGQAKIFDSFTQADSSNSREFGGAGLGLFITNKLVTMMNGNIKIRSRMNEGSHFTVQLKLKLAGSSESNPNLLGTLSGTRALIVDDNETNRTILYHQLISWGVVAEAVESGVRALEALRRARDAGKQFDVAILDLHMPVMDGLALTRAIQADESLRDLPRMMLTSAALNMTPAELESIGVDQYISKPARQTQLYNALSGILPGGAKESLSVAVQPEAKIYEKIDGHVLLAEDNLINQEVAYNMLENFGCTVEIVSNGRSALEACENQYFDVIFMDCEMPIINGLEATQILRAGASPNKQTPVVALTANVMKGDREQCIDSGMNDYLSKPVKQGELYRCMSEWSKHEGKGSRIKAVELNQIERQVVDNISTIPPVYADSEISATTQSEKVVSINRPVKDNSANTSHVLSEENSPDANQELSDEGHDQTTKIDRDSNVVDGEIKQIGNSEEKDTGREEAQNTLSQESDVVNTKAIDNIRRLQRKGKPDLVTKVLNVYLEKSPEIITEITEGFIAQDKVRVKEAAHSMKSSSAYVGADSISEMCRQIELAADKDSLGDVKTLIDELSGSYQRVVAILSGYLDKAA